ncbi:MAG TPA: choice-of-anchor tandem repeat NxxGxxAF-containing protein [Acetobacteraceae bacterium]|nr:choice-of-anchor tandem repeat NxxGxxAF-containing protein [Acetobacteraceae bacterium]
MLLAAAWRRLLVAGVAVAALWAAVLWVAPSTPSTAPAQPSLRVAAQPKAAAVFETGALRAVVRSGLAAPGGGRFDRFDVTAQPIVAPVNARGQVAFYATVLHAPAREGIFLTEAGHVTKVAAFGDGLPGGGTLAEFGAHPLPSLNSAGHVAFDAQIAGGRATDGIFLAGADGLQAIALAGDDAPGVAAGVLVGFDAPALNDNDELAFVAEVRRGRDTLDVLYFWNGQRLQRLVAEGDRLLRIGGTMDKIGEPALNNSGVIAFPAAIFKGPALGGIFVAGARDLRLLVGSGDRAPSGAIIQRFSERVAIDDEDGIAFGAYLGEDGVTREAVLRTGPEGLAEIAVEGAPAPGGGRYAGFGPWPTVGPSGVTAFVAALDGGPGPLAAFAGAAGDIRRVATMGETLPQGGSIGRFALNGVAVAGPGGALTFATVAQNEGERNAIYCRCPESAR